MSGVTDLGFSIYYKNMADTEDVFYDESGELILPGTVTRLPTVSQYTEGIPEVLKDKLDNGEYFVRLTPANAQSLSKTERWLSARGFETYHVEGGTVDVPEGFPSEYDDPRLYYW